jgi:predicted DNA-binding antitoxin AbrB/MazE fold protein
MRQVIEAIFENGLLKPLRKLHLPEGRHVNVILETDEDSAADAGGSYNFSDLAGKLSWNGDAVEAQRRIRDEW